MKMQKNNMFYSLKYFSQFQQETGSKTTEKNILQDFTGNKLACLAPDFSYHAHGKLWGPLITYKNLCLLI